MVLTAAIAALPLYGCGADQTTSGVVCPQVWKNETNDLWGWLLTYCVYRRIETL